MSEWSGFSDEALKKLTKSKENIRSNKQLPTIKTGNSSKINARKNIGAISIANAQSDKLNSDQKLCVAKIDSGTDKNNESKSDVPTSQVLHKLSSTGTGPQETLALPIEQEDKTVKDCSGEEVKTLIIDDSTFKEKERVTLDQFRDRQKEIEEMNKKKRIMLTNAISEKVKRTKEEGEKLSLIRRELEALDMMVSTDVSLIRDRIEVVTRNYAFSQRRYEEAEKEFIAAKIELHERSEMKEQLIEHLYTIIHQNEIRKAQKLDQLTSQLDSNVIKKLPLESIQDPLIIPSTLNSTIGQPDIQKFRHKMQAGLDSLLENNAEVAKKDVTVVNDLIEKEKPKDITEEK